MNLNKLKSILNIDEEAKSTYVEKTDLDSIIKSDLYPFS